MRVIEDHQLRAGSLALDARVIFRLMITS